MHKVHVDIDMVWPASGRTTYAVTVTTSGNRMRMLASDSQSCRSVRHVNDEGSVPTCYHGIPNMELSSVVTDC